MTGLKRACWSLAWILALLISRAGSGSAAAIQPKAAELEPPPGFEDILSFPGATLYKKDYENGTPDYVQVAELSAGASVRLMHGEVSDPSTDQGAYGGDNPQILRQSLRQYWNQLAEQSANAFCVVNGAFFSTNPDPAPLAFPLKVDGQILSEGYGKDEYPGEKYMLELWSSRAEITPLTPEALKTSSAPNILAGLSEQADKSPSALTGRTFVGVADQDNDGVNEILLVFSTRTASQADAARVLRDFGANKVMMLDGGDSSQLICNGTPYITTSRTLPQALAILHKMPPPLSASIVRQTSFPVLVEGESTDVEIELRNSGSETWKAGEVRLANQRNPYGASAEYPLTKDIAPGDTVTFIWQTQTFDRWGVYPSDWQMQRLDTPFDGSALRFTYIVLPKQLAEKREELKANIRDWVNQKADDIETRILAWIQDHLDRVIHNTTRKLCGSPLLPLIAAIWFGLLRKRFFHS